MRQATCSRCKATGALQSMFESNGYTYCESCANTVAYEAKQSGHPATFARHIDPSLCARCGTANPSGNDFPVLKKLPFCEKCGPLVEKWPYPTWLKLSLAALLLLLVVALAHGKSYFYAGRELYVGERFVEESKFAEAVAHLKESARIAPNSDKAVLLLAKAALKIGDVGTAASALQGHQEGHFDDGKDAAFLEVKSMWDRATQAIEKANQAGKLEEQDGKEVEAAKLMHEAAAMYPESKELALAVQAYEEGVAFAQKDYDRYLSIAEGEWQKRPVAMNGATLASAWACKYAASSNVEYKQNAEEMLLKAQQLAQGDPEAMKSLEEYLPRIRYRIDSRQIITRQEFDKKFRNQKAPKK